MKCLTVRQPWAYLLAHGIKDVENRTWRTHYRGELLIHAAAQPDTDAAIAAVAARIEVPGQADPKWWDDALLAAGWDGPGQFGAIVGVVTLTRCDQAFAFGQPECSPWCEYPEPLRRLGIPFWWWRVACAHTLRESVSMKGRLGLWDVTDLDVLDEAGHLRMGDEEWLR